MPIQALAINAAALWSYPQRLDLSANIQALLMLFLMAQAKFRGQILLRYSRSQHKKKVLILLGSLFLTAHPTQDHSQRRCLIER